MAIPDYAKITGKTVQHVEIQTEHRESPDDVQDVREIEHAMVIYFTGGSSLRVFVGGEEPWQYLGYDFTPEKKTAAKKKKK